MRLIGLVALLAPGLAVAADTAPWVGVWSAEPEWCAFADRIGSHEPAPIELTATEFLGYEKSCELTRVKRVIGMSAWQFHMRCQSEGSSYDEVVLGTLEGDDTLWWFAAHSEPVRFQRCPR